MTYRLKITGIATGKAGLRTSKYEGEEIRFEASRNRVSEEAQWAIKGWLNRQLKGKKGWYKFMADGTVVLAVDGLKHRLSFTEAPFVFDPVTRRVL